MVAFKIMRDLEAWTFLEHHWGAVSSLAVSEDEPQTPSQYYILFFNGAGKETGMRSKKASKDAPLPKIYLKMISYKQGASQSVRRIRYRSRTYVVMTSWPVGTSFWPAIRSTIYIKTLPCPWIILRESFRSLSRKQN